MLLGVIVLLLSGCSFLEEQGQADIPENVPADITGTVTRATDGDTFTVMLENGEEEKVRPILVNAPEICHKSSPAEDSAELCFV